MIPPCRQPINTRSQIVRYTITTRQKRLIRTPLNAIVGFSNLLADTSDIEEREQVHPIPRVISAKNQEQIFDRFIKLNTFAKGTGLGLSIYKSIV